MVDVVGESWVDENICDGVSADGSGHLHALELEDSRESSTKGFSPQTQETIDSVQSDIGKKHTWS